MFEKTGTVFTDIEEKLLRKLHSLLDETTFVNKQLKDLRLFEIFQNEHLAPDNDCYHKFLLDCEDGPFLTLEQRVELISNYSTDRYTWLRPGEKPGKYELCPECRLAVRRGDAK